MSTGRNGIRIPRLLGIAAALAVVSAGGLALNLLVRDPAWKDASAEALAGGPGTALIRISPDQYRQIIADVFGSAIQVNGRFVEPGVRQEGLLAVGASRVSVTSAGLEAADAMASDIAEQVFSPGYRAVVMPCSPRSEIAADDECAARFLESAGRLLLRRPLAGTELKSYVAIASDGAEATGSFFSGMRMSLRNMLVSPEFLFRLETAVPSPKQPGEYRLDSYSRASRLSFLLWNSTPDEELLAAAGRGDLETTSGLRRQVDRMLDSPRLQNGVRAFFVDLLGFDHFAILNKDSTLFPQFTAQVVSDAQEQTLRTVIDLLLTRDGDYRDLFTSRRTFLTPSLGALYGVPVIQAAENGAVDQWVAHEFPGGDPRAGLLAQAGFVALHSHPGRSSPTSRGKALREQLLCQTVPAPPGDVDFSLVQDISNPKYKTARQRLSVHAAQPACAGCHNITDPIGLALENFDAAGAFRTEERGAPIDTSGELNGVEFDGPLGLGEALHADPGVPACLVTRIFGYGTSRAPAGIDLPFLRTLRSEFAASKYRLRALLRRLATAEEFYRRPRPPMPVGEAPILSVAAPGLETAGMQASVTPEYGGRE